MEKEKEGCCYLFTYFRFDFEQIDFEALLHLSRLLLGRRLFRTETGNLPKETPRHIPMGSGPPGYRPLPSVSSNCGMGYGGCLLL